MTYEVEERLEERTLVYTIAVVDEQLDGVITMPALQAYRNSPNWHPVVCADGVIYIWGRTAPEDIEAILLPTTLVPRSWKWTMYTITRSKKRPYIILVDPRIIGGRISNIFREPVIVTEKYKHEFIIQWLLSKTTILKELNLEDCRVDVDNVKCENEEYVVLYSVKLHFNELYFIPTTVRKEKQ